MNFETFKDELIKELRKRLGTHNVIVTHCAFSKKKNDVLQLIQNGTSVICTIYPLFCIYKLKHSPISHFADLLLESIPETDNIFEIDKSKIFYRLINLEDNKELLEDIPYMQFHDIAVTFVYQTKKSIQNNTYLLITNSIMEELNLPVQELSKLAAYNTFQVHPGQTRLFFMQTLERIYFDPNASLDEFLQIASIGFQGRNDAPLLCVKCSDYLYGSAVLLDTDFWKSLSIRLESSLLIIPNSEQELVVMSYKDNENKEILKEELSTILSDGNETILSRHIYFFDKEKKQLIVFE